MSDMSSIPSLTLIQSSDLPQCTFRKKHKRSFSLFAENLDINNEHFMVSGSVDFSRQNRPIFVDSNKRELRESIDDNLLTQNEVYEKVQYIETLEPNFAQISGESGRSFIPIQRRFCSQNFENSSVLKSLEIFGMQATERHRPVRVNTEKGQLSSILEQSEFVSSIKNSIQKHSQHDFQRAVSGQLTISDRGEKSKSFKLQNFDLKFENEDDHSLVLKKDKGGNFQEVFCNKKVKIGWRNQIAIKDLFPHKSAKLDLHKDPFSKLIKMQPKLEILNKKVACLNSGTFQLGRLSDESNKKKQMLLNQFSAKNKNDKIENLFEVNSDKNLSFENTFAKNLKKKEFFSEFKRNFGFKSPVLSPETKIKQAKEKSAYYSTFLRKEINCVKKENTKNHQLKNAKCYEKPDVIQRLFKFKSETKQLQPRKDKSQILKQKMRTTNFLPVENEKRFKVAQMRNPVSSYRQNSRPVHFIDSVFKHPIFHKFNQIKRVNQALKNKDEASKSFDAKDFILPKNSQSKISLAGFKWIDPQRFKLSKQARLKTETEPSCKYPDMSVCKPGFLSRFIQSQQNATKIRNLNILFPMELASSEVSVDLGLLLQNPVDKNNKANKIEALDIIAPVNSGKVLFGKTRSLSSACLSKMTEKAFSNGVFPCTTQNLAELISPLPRKISKFYSRDFGSKIELGKQMKRNSHQDGLLQHGKIKLISQDFIKMAGVVDKKSAKWPN